MTYDLLLKNIARHITLTKEETDHFTSCRLQRNTAKDPAVDRRATLHYSQLCSYRSIKGLLPGQGWQRIYHHVCYRRLVANGHVLFFEQEAGHGVYRDH